MDDRTAWSYMLDMLEHMPGYLKIITSTRNPNTRLGLRVDDPRNFIAHKVVKLEPYSILTGQGYARAYSEEGDICQGRPFPLLKQLTRYERATAPLDLRPTEDRVKRIQYMRELGLAIGLRQFRPQDSVVQLETARIGNMKLVEPTRPNVIRKRTR